VRYEAQCGLGGPIRDALALQRMNMTVEPFQERVVDL